MKTVTLDEANEYMDLNIRSAKKTAIATASYVLSPVAFLFWQACLNTDSM